MHGPICLLEKGAQEEQGRCRARQREPDVRSAARSRWRERSNSAAVGAVHVENKSGDLGKKIDLPLPVQRSIHVYCLAITYMWA
jgi:hypothetical protein